MLEAFQEYRVSEPCFAGTTGYGYDDLGRETLEKVWARVFGAESALVRVNFVNGTHAIATALFSALRPGDTLLSVMGAPYDTLRTAIGISGSGHGSLEFYGIGYAQVDTLSGGPDMEAIGRAAAELRPAAALVQRSRGYDARRALTVDEIGEICRVIKSASPAHPRDSGQLLRRVHRRDGAHHGGSRPDSRLADKEPRRRAGPLRRAMWPGRPTWSKTPPPGSPSPA